MNRPRSTDAKIQWLSEGWTRSSTAPGAASAPAALDGLDLRWLDAIVPGTVAQSLHADLDGRHDFDGEDWWYRCTFLRSGESSGSHTLCFDGLATLAEVWLNGALILSSRNMFRAHQVDVAVHLKETNELVICFRSLRAELEQKKPRPRWKTALVNYQNLRWVRTTLLGRIPGWTPDVPAVGPWKGISLVSGEELGLGDFDLQTNVSEGVPHLSLRAAVHGELTSASLEVGSLTVPLSLNRIAVGHEISCEVSLEGLALWWPHTHGESVLHEAKLRLMTSKGSQIYALGRLGFKAVELNREDGKVDLRVNGRSVFCRGACWTVNEIRTLSGDGKTLRESLLLAQEAGLNMLRVGGTMVYESDAFYDLCDELGILVWQDFMFANMDYPFGDAAFHAEAKAEVREQLHRFQRHACFAMYCGGSEIEQQAAMLGLPSDQWSQPFFAEELPAWCGELHRGIPYVPSTPCEGALPFHVSTGVAHYYGVGAYRRPLSDVKLAGVKFTSECLGFSNVPEEETMALLSDGGAPVPHHPRWKAGVPRDNGAGWDFEDVRNHYLKELYGVDPVMLRSADLERYYALSRAVTGEVMHHAFKTWRTQGQCGGGLVWFFKDLRPGAGWGILDSENRPKAAYWHLKRAWAKQAVYLIDEGLDGMDLRVLNEADHPLDAQVELELLQHGRIRVGHALQPMTIPARGQVRIQGDKLLGHFTDLTHVYRFGPPSCDVIIARLRNLSGDRVLFEDVHFPLSHGLMLQCPVELRAEVHADGESYRMTLSSPVFLQGVSLTSKDHRPEDNHFHLTPGAPREIRWRPSAEARPFKAYLSALNMKEVLTIRSS